MHELVCTPVPSKDHAYSFAEWLVIEAQQVALAVACSMESPVDEVYDFGEIYCDSEVSSTGSYEVLSDVDSRSSRSPVRRSISRRSWTKPDDDVEDEERRRLEGVRALLNLASGTKADQGKKSRRLPLSRSLWTKAVSTHLKKQRKQSRRLGKVQKKKVNKSKAKRVKKVMRRRTR